MIKYCFYLLNLVFLFFFNSKMLYSQDTVIVGKAHNAKHGAVVVSSNDEVYYIDKLASWDVDTIERKVKITGNLVIRKLKKLKTRSAGINAPDIKIIKKHKIQILSAT